LTIKESKKKSIREKLQAICFKDPEIKYLGQKAFISYVRSVYVQKHKDIFKVESIDYDKFAESLGLPGAPKIKIHGGQKSKDVKNAPRSLVYGDDDEEAAGPGKQEKVRTKYDRMFERKNQNVLSEHYLNLTKGDGDDGSDDEFMSVKRRDHILDSEEVPQLDSAPVSKRSAKKALSKKQSLKDKGNPTKLVFDDQGRPHAIYEFEDEDDFRAAGDADAQKADFVTREREAMAAYDIEDKKVAREKRQEKKRKRLEARRRAEEGEGSEVEVVLGGQDDNISDEPDLERDMAYPSEDEDQADERSSKKPRKWFEKGNVGTEGKSKPAVLEVGQLDSLEDLESLSTRLIRGR
jgi:ATP-dependent RNA helicase DDX10/DBP4